jgi:hypothetical protein
MTKDILEELVFSKSRRWIKRNGLYDEYVVVKCSLHDAGSILIVSILMPPCDAKGPLPEHVPKKIIIGEIWELASRLSAIKMRDIIILDPKGDIVLWAPWDGHRLIYPDASGSKRSWEIGELMAMHVTDVLRRFVVYRKGIETCKNCKIEHEYVEFYNGNDWQKISDCPMSEMYKVLATIVGTDGKEHELGVMKSPDSNRPGWILVRKDSRGKVEQMCIGTFKTIDVARLVIQRVWRNPEWRLRFVNR